MIRALPPLHAMSCSWAMKYDAKTAARHLPRAVGKIHYDSVVVLFVLLTGLIGTTTAS